MDEKEKDHSAALLPGDPSAAVTTGALPDSQQARLDLIASVEPIIHPANREAFYRRVRALVSATRVEALQDAIALVKERGDVENHVVAPGLWFAAGWLRLHLLEPMVGSGTPATLEPADPPRRSAAP